MTADASGTLSHALQSKVSVLPPIRNNGIKTCAIVTYTQGKLARISELDLQLTCPRMSTCVADGFVTDAINFVTDDGMHLSGIADYGKCDHHGVGDEAILGHAPESFSQVVGLTRRCAQGVQRRPPR